MWARVLLSVLLGFLCIPCLPAGCFAAGEHRELTIRPVPAPWFFQDRYHPCGLFIGLEEERYGKKASEVLAAANPKSSDGMAQQVVRAVAAKNSDFLRGILLNPDAPSLKGFDLDRWLKYFDMPEDPTLLRVYRLGKASLYIFQSHRSEPSFLPVLITPSEGKFYFDLAGQDDPLCNLVIVLNRAMASNAAAFDRVEKLEGYRGIDLPSVFGDKDREHPARLYFKGIQYVAQVYPLDENGVRQLPRTNSPRLDGAVTFYANLWKRLADGDTDAFAAALLDPTMVEFIQKTDKKQLGEMFCVTGRSRQPRQVNFVLYSDNVFWMFNQFFAGAYRQKSLNYHIVIWDEASKSYKLVRVCPTLDALTSFTQWKEFSKIFIDATINASAATTATLKDESQYREAPKGSRD